MKKITQITSLVAAIVALGSTTLHAQVDKSQMINSNSQKNPNNKMLICHIPPGNPANAHTIEVSINAANAHLNGNNSHRDFVGDCFSGCDGFEVIAVEQGLQSNGTAVPASRSNIDKVYEFDGINQDGGFYSLGFGGSMVIRFNGGILNAPGNDLKLFETTFNQGCTAYPERAEIEVSQDGTSWTSLGLICHDGEVDIAPMDWIQFVRITDRTNPADFGNQVVDGYDVDGITCINRMQSDRRVETLKSISLFPNPAVDQLTIAFHDVPTNELIDVRIYDMVGRVVYQNQVSLSNEVENVQVPVSNLRSGVHTLQITGAGVDHRQQIVKQ